MAEVKQAELTGTEVTVAQPAALDVSQYANMAITQIEGFEEFDRSDLVIPRYKIVQGTTRGLENRDKKIGQWYSTLDGEARPEMDIVVLRYSHSRAMFEKDNFTPEGLLCMSTNGRQPQARFTPEYGPLCEECLYSEWGENDKGERIKPPCGAGYTFLCLDPETEMPFLMSWMGMAVKLSKRMVTSFIAKKRPPFYSIVRLGTKYIEDNKNSYYVPTFAIFDNPDAEAVMAYRQAYLAYASIDLEADAGVVDDGAAEGDGDAGQKPDDLPF